MAWQYTPYLLPLALATAVAIGLVLFGWRRRRTPGAIPLIVLMSAVAEWALTYALELASSNLEAKILWDRLEFLGIVVVPAAWLAFTLQYTGRGSWLRPRFLALLAIEPILTVLLVWTNPYHHLVWHDIHLNTSPSLPMLGQSPGVGFLAHTAYSYLVMLSGTLLLIQVLARRASLYRRQAGPLLFAAFIPWVGNAISLFGLPRFPELDLTPFAFVLSGLAVAWSLFRHQFLRLVPVARDTVIEGMVDGLIVLDMQNRIVDLNPAAQQAIGCAGAQAIGRPLAQVWPGRPELLEGEGDAGEARLEVVLGEGEGRRCFDLHLSPLYRRHSPRKGRPEAAPSGRLVVLHDMTERKRFEATLIAQEHFFENLVAVARATVARPTLEATLHSMLPLAVTLTGAEVGSLFMLNEAGEVTHELLEPARMFSAQREMEAVQLVMHEGLPSRVAQQGRPALIHDTAQDDRCLALSNDLSLVRSALSLPILSGSTLLGVLTLAHSIPGHFSEKDLSLMQAAADQMALALRSVQMYEVQHRLANQQTTLYEVLRRVGAQLDPDTAAQVAVETIVRLTGWPEVSISLPNEAGTHLLARAMAGPASVPRGWIQGATEGIIGRAFHTGQIQYAPDVSADPDYVEGHPSIRSELAVPLQRGEQTLGVLNLERDQLSGFDTDDILLAESLAEAISLAMDIARLYTAAQKELVERKRVAEELREAKEVAESADRAKGAFLASMSHELRTPLSAIIGYSELLHDEARERGYSGIIPDLEKIRAAGGHLLALINNILDFSKIEAGRMELYLETFDIAALIDEAVMTAQSLVEKNGNVLQVQLADQLGAMHADQTKIKQILLNLLGNAAKFTERGTITLAVTREQSDEADWVVFRVADTGIGMTPAQMRNLFQSFSQGDAATTRRYGGTGLGLAISHRLCQMMGGQISAVSREGSGSTFTVRIPAQVSPHRAEHEPPLQSPES